MKCSSVALSMCMIFPRSSTIWRSGMILTPSIIGASARTRPPERAIEPAFLEQVVEPLEARVSPVEVGIASQTDALERPDQIRGAQLGCPSELESRKRTGELAEVGLVRPLVGARLAQDLDAAPGHRLGRDLGQAEDLMVQMIRSVVERLVVDQLDRGIQDGLKAPGD